MTDWAFAHPILTTFIVLAVIEAMAAPFRWQRRRRPHRQTVWRPGDRRSSQMSPDED